MTKTFKQFLNEEDIPALVDILKRDCKQFLHQSGGKLLYRGMDRLGEYQNEVMLKTERVSYYKKSIRKDRRPSTTNKTIHEYIDDWFEEKFNVRPRSNAAFCYGADARNVTLFYGSKGAVIFPIGEFKTIWSPNISDLFGKLDEDDVDGNSPRENVDHYLNEYDYQQGGLKSALGSKSEIMIVGENFYCIDTKQFGLVDEILEALKQ